LFRRSICEDTIYDLRNSFHRLFSSCQRLEKIDLSFNHEYTNHVLESLPLCKNLKYLKLIDVSCASDVCFEIFLHCPKLEVIYLPQIVTKRLTNQLNERYQHITILFYDNLRICVTKVELEFYPIQ
jgi:hypothetical protein